MVTKHTVGVLGEVAETLRMLVDGAAKAAEALTGEERAAQIGRADGLRVALDIVQNLPAARRPPRLRDSIEATIAEFERLERDRPDTYAALESEIQRVVVVMTAMRLVLDIPPGVFDEHRTMILAAVRELDLRGVAEAVRAAAAAAQDADDDPDAEPSN